MSQHKQLVVQERNMVGRQVKQLRDSGLTPANIYGLQLTSQAVAVPAPELKRLMSQVGESEIIEITVGDDSKTRPVLVSGVQRDPVTREILHVDFRQVDLTKEVTVPVEIVFEGESPITKSGQAVLLELMTEVEVTALPDKLPSEIVIDVSKLENIGDQITLADLTLGEGVVIEAEDMEQPICKVDAVQVTEEEEETAEATETAGEEAADSEAPAESETPPTEE